MKMLLTTGKNNQQKNQEGKQKHDKLKKQTNRKEMLNMETNN